MLLAAVIVDIPSREVSRPFDYLVPSELADVQVGCAVSVEFGTRPVVGYVMELFTCDEKELAERGLERSKLKSLAGILSTPYFDVVSARLMTWIAQEYVCPLSSALALFTPPGGSPKIKRVEGEWQLVHPGVGPVDDRWVLPGEAFSSFVPRDNAIKQIAVMEALSEGGMRVAELSLALGSVTSAIKALEKRGVVRIEHRRRIRDAMPELPQHSSNPVDLTDGQRGALELIDQMVGDRDNSEKVVVVDGITGSGKTEVYLQAISKVIAEGKSAIVLVPEISLTPQTVGRFRARFGNDVAVLHSRLSTGERYDQWDIVCSGLAHVVVGTRSALFAPVKDLGLIIIDEEHEGSYKQESAPRYVSRDVARRMCAMRDALLVLGSATPSLDTLARCRSDYSDSKPWGHALLRERPNRKPLPPVTVVDMSREFASGSRSMFSHELVKGLQEVHERGEKAVLLLNKRGFASFVLCRECGFVPECPDCSVSLTFHEAGNYLACHHCDHTEPTMPRCPNCGSPYLRKFGTGTERVEGQLRQVVADNVPIIRMDADTTRSKGAHEQLLDQFRQGKGGILLGTQMIAKGLDFPDVTLVGVINADTTLKLPDYRAGERTFQLLEQVSGRAGRGDKDGRVIVQTYWPEHPAIRAAAAHDRNLFLEGEVPARHDLRYPPFVRLANILIWGKSERGVRSAAMELGLALNSMLETKGLDWDVLGPSSCLLGKLRGNFRWHILVKASADEEISPVLSELLSKQGKRKDDVRIAVDVDPCDLL